MAESKVIIMVEKVYKLSTTTLKHFYNKFCLSSEFLRGFKCSGGVSILNLLILFKVKVKIRLSLCFN